LLFKLKGFFLYSNFFFLLLVFLIPSLALDHSSPLIQSEGWTYVLSIVSYLSIFLLILIQNYYIQPFLKVKKNRILLIVQIELILFLLFLYYILDTARLFSHFPLSQFLSNLFAISIYLTGLWFYYCTRSFFFLKTDTKKAFKETSFILPFILPFLIFSLAIDLFYMMVVPYFDYYLANTSAFNINILLTSLILLASFLMMLLFPYIIQLIWQCKPLSNETQELAKKFELICKQANFKHAGIKTWGLLDDSLSAAIIGIIPKVRYILFTKKILKQLSFNALSAILVHEIGHSYRKHLLIYPFIIAGIFFVLSGFENAFLSTLSPLIFFIAYVLIIIFYFRIVFGFFSRIFEREADLHVYVLNINPEYMIEALDRVATIEGNIHLMPCWHHYSIQQRIDFLRATIKDPSLIKKHHAHVKKVLFFYSIALILTAIW